jgi:ABC-type dipeptide/oligopeptide/nickel transport system permease subunit
MFILTWRRFAKSKGGLLGLALILLLFAMAALAPWIAPHPPLAMDQKAIYSPPNLKYLLGTDELGRDILSRIIFGSRVIIKVCFSATLVASLVGIALGVMAAYRGGVIDDLIMRFADVLLSFPAFLLAIALVAFLGANVLNIILVIALTRLPRYARLIRGSALSVKQMEFVEAARAVGAGHLFIILRHVLPNCLGPIVVFSTLTLGDSILTISGLSFLGLGIQPPAADWGVMLARGKEYLLTAPWIAFFPGIAIFLTVMGFNLMGDSFRDALDPKSL